MSYDDMRKVMRETDEYMHKAVERDDTKTESDTCAFEHNAEQVNSSRDETPVLSIFVAIAISLCIFILIFGGVTSRYSSLPSETATSIRRAEAPVGAYRMNDGSSDGLPREDIVRILAARDRRVEIESGRESGSWMWFMLPLFFLR